MQHSTLKAPDCSAKLVPEGPACQPHRDASEQARVFQGANIARFAEVATHAENRLKKARNDEFWLEVATMAYLKKKSYADAERAAVRWFKSYPHASESLNDFTLAHDGRNSTERAGQTNIGLAPDGGTPLITSRKFSGI